MGTIRLFKVWLLIGLMVLSRGSIAYAQTNTFPDSGNVGIGTTNPNATTEIAKSVTGFSSTSHLVLYNSHETDGDYSGILFGNRSVPGNRGKSWFGTARTGDNGVGDFVFLQDSAADDAGIATTDEVMRIKSNGNVGIGTTNPNGTTEIAKNVIGFSSTSHLVLYNSHETDGDYSGILFGSRSVPGNRGRSWFGAVRTGDFGVNDFVFLLNPAADGTGIATTDEVMRIKSNGNVGIGATNPTSKLHVAGDAKITGDLTVDGNIAAKYQDVAEWVRTPTPLAAGTVVVIDPLESNRVLPSSQSYDTRIAGVVSSQPGIILGEAGEDKAKVAHSGRVKVKVDAQFGPISVGDLLVSSATTGYAMRSTLIEMNGISLHRPGTIVGKALEPLKEGEGEILVLLTLQ